jgi:hypothetical protein
MAEPLTLTSQHLATFLDCRRQFQLRYRQRFPWPARPQDEEQQLAVERGLQFHQMAHRHFLGLPVAPPGADPLLAEWWQRFVATGPVLPPGQRLPELTVTVPLGRRLLSGRIDLLVLGENAAHIFDWKTGPLPDEATLRSDWLTWLYPALVVAAGPALHPSAQPVRPEHISLTYWSAVAPAAPLRLAYDAATHEYVWQQLLAVAAELDDLDREPDIWPLTRELSICSACRYRVLCGRQFVPAQPGASRIAEEPPVYNLEPDLP